MMVSRAIPEDLGNVVLRPADELECQAAGLDGPTAITLSRDLADVSRMITHNGQPVAYWGYRVTNLIGGEALFWLLTTPLVDSHRMWFARYSRRICNHMLTKFRVIRVYVHGEHDQAINWLLWLGFHIEEMGPFLTMIRGRDGHGV